MFKLLDNFTRRLTLPQLTWTRIIAAVAIAATADGLQIVLGPLGWIFLDGVIDVVAMALTVLVIGFHPLLLPTFIVELIPLADMLPTWTGCVIAVIALRNRRSPAMPSVQTGLPAEKKSLSEKSSLRSDSDI